MVIGYNILLDAIWLSTMEGTRLAWIVERDKDNSYSAYIKAKQQQFIIKGDRVFEAYFSI